MLPLAVCQAQIDHTFVNMEIASGGLLPYQSVRELDAKHESIKGDVYLYEQWSECDVKLKGNEKMVRVMANFNLRNVTLEILVKQSIYILDRNRVDYVVPGARDAEAVRFVDGYGICEVISGKDPGVFRSHSVSLKKANYNPSHDVGNRFDEWIKKEELLISSNGNYYKAGRKKTLLKKMSQDMDIPKEATNLLSNKPDESELISFVSRLSQR